MMRNQKNKKLLKELDAPKDAKATMLRLLSHLKDQRARLTLVIICVSIRFLISGRLFTELPW